MSKEIKYMKPHEFDKFLVKNPELVPRIMGIYRLIVNQETENGLSEMLCKEEADRFIFRCYSKRLKDTLTVELLKSHI